MKTCPRCGSIKLWQLSTGQIRCSRCGLTKKVSKNLWKKSRISPYWKGRLVEHFCLGVPAYHLRFQVPYSQPTIQRWFRMLREAIYLNTIKELEPLSGEIKMDETMFWSSPDKTDTQLSEHGHFFIFFRTMISDRRM